MYFIKLSLLFIISSRNIAKSFTNGLPSSCLTISVNSNLSLILNVSLTLSPIGGN